MKRAFSAALVTGGLLITGAPALAAGGFVGADPAPAVVAPTTVASGLDNPRGLAFDRNGALYVAEAGKGGTAPCRPGPEGGQVCFGLSGAITKIARGSQRRVVSGLPSSAAPDGTQASGPSDVYVDKRGKVLYLIGLGGSPDLRDQVTELANTAKLYRIGARSAVADPGAYEKRANPDGVQPPDTNPNSVTDGAIADAGGNSLLKLGSNGRLSTLATFAGRSVTGPAGTPVTMQAVPTSVVRGPDGSYYVGELTGFPFPAGQARVWKVRPGHRATVYATGFTNIIDLAFGPDGKLLVLEIAKNGLLSGDKTGALLRVDRRGRSTEIISTGLTSPGGLAVRGRDAYVSNCSVCAGQGSVLKISLR